MVIIRAPESDSWVAFNPGTCGVQKVWRGGMDFRGKVWDFSQDNCRAAPGAVVLAEADSTLAALGDGPEPGAGWTVHDAEPLHAERAEGWRFVGDGGGIKSPVFDAAGWERVFIAFDERSRSGPLRVEVSNDAGATWTAQSFVSTVHGTSDTDWQFNFKLVDRPSTQMRVVLMPEPGAFGKQVRRLRVFGDRPAWTGASGDDPDAGAPVRPVWRGYERPRVSGPVDAVVCRLMYDLEIAGQTVHVRESIGFAGGVHHRYELTGGAPGLRLRLRPARQRPSVWFTLKMADSAPGAAGVLPRQGPDGLVLEIAVDGDAPVRFEYMVHDGEGKP